MDVYEKDSDRFSPEYLAYLRTLTSEVSTGRMRQTKNPDGELVRLEFWTESGTYIDMPLSGWMKPKETS
jgi:hypothetical protein